MRLSTKGAYVNPKTSHQTAAPSDRVTEPSAMIDGQMSSDGVYSLPDVHYPKDLNAAHEMVDTHVEDGKGDNVAVYFEDEALTYNDLEGQTNRLGNGLREMGVDPGDRVFVRLPNRPEYIVTCLAVQKIGAIPVPSMKLLQSSEVEYVLNDSGASYAVVYEDLLEAVEGVSSHGLEEIVVVESSGDDHGHRRYADLMSQSSVDLEEYGTTRDDFALLAYTSGTTGQPKGTVHTHQEMLSITDTYARHCLKPTEDDVFGGNPPIAFTFGYGLLVAFPLRFGASTVLIEDATPEKLLEGVDSYGITILGSVPTAYNQMLGDNKDITAEYDLLSLRVGVSAGEPLTPDTYHRVKSELGIPLLDGIGTTEMLHIFISHSIDRQGDPSATGYPVPGYECKVADPETGEELERGEPGLLMVRGPTGVTYWDRPDKQDEATHDGWSIPGDIFVQHENGLFEHKSRRDDLIISSGYKIPGPEVEEVLQERDEVKESAVVGSPDDERGTIVKAFVILDDEEGGPEMETELQNYVKSQIAPYKYPREIAFVDELPMTESGKIKRAKLRAQEQEGPAVAAGD